MAIKFPGDFKDSIHSHTGNLLIIAFFIVFLVNEMAILRPTHFANEENDTSVILTNAAAISSTYFLVIKSANFLELFFAYS